MILKHVDSPTGTRLVFFCDLCNEPIEDSHNAAAVWYKVKEGDEWVTEDEMVVHSGSETSCFAKLVARDQRQRSGRRVMADVRLDAELVYLLLDTKTDLVEATRMAFAMAGFAMEDEKEGAPALLGHLGVKPMLPGDDDSAK